MSNPQVCFKVWNSPSYTAPESLEHTIEEIMFGDHPRSDGMRTPEEVMARLLTVLYDKEVLTLKEISTEILHSDEMHEVKR